MRCPHSKTECEHYKSRKKNNTSEPSPMPAFWSSYGEIYEKAFGKQPIIKFARDTKVLKDLLRLHNIDALIKLIPKYFDNLDSFFKKSAYDIPRFEKYVTSLATGGYDAGLQVISSGGREGVGSTKHALEDLLRKRGIRPPYEPCGCSEPSQGPVDFEPMETRLDSKIIENTSMEIEEIR